MFSPQASGLIARADGAIFSGKSHPLMKTIRAAFAASLLLANLAHAVPQSVGNGFLGAVGIPFEKFAAAAGPWAQGAELKGPWKARAEKKGDVENFDLAVDAIVFGIPAAQVSAERVSGAVRRFTVRFDEGKMRNAKSSAGGLYAQVVANITALAGEPKASSPGGEKSFRYESSLITARKSGAKEVIVDFTPAK